MPRKENRAQPAASRRTFLKATVAGSAAAALTPFYSARGAAREIESDLPASDIKAFELDESTIADLQDGMKSGKFTARSLVEKYSARIDEIDKHGPALNSVIEMNLTRSRTLTVSTRSEKPKDLAVRSTASRYLSRTTSIPQTG